VSASGAVDFPPFGGINTDFEAAGTTHSEKWTGQVGFCDPPFFGTVGARLLKGRFLTEADAAGKRKVAVVNQTLAAKFFPGQDPIGKRIKLTGLEQAPEPLTDPWFEIVGVSTDIKNHGVRQDVVPEAYAPYTLSSFGGFIAFLRTAGNPRALTMALEGEVLAMDKSVLPQQTNTMDEALDTFEYAQPRFGLQLFSVFAAVGLILVTVGVYSVVSYTVSQQSREIGIRMALGASAGNVRGLVLVSGMRFIVIGVGIGLVVAFGLMRLLKSQIYGVTAYDPVTLLAVVVILSFVGVAACYLPSRRATRVDPLVSLRYE
jgi:predicted permease